MSRDFKVPVKFSKLYPKVIIPCVIIMFLFIIRTIYVINSEIQTTIKTYNANEVFKFCVTEVEGCFNYYFDVAKNYNFLFYNYGLISDTARRSFFNAITKSIMNYHNDILSVWADFDENKFDSLDAFYKNSEYYSEKGRFNIFWYREDDYKKTLKFRKYSSEQQQIYLSQPYIVLSKSTKKPTIALYKRFDNNSNDYSNNYNFDDYSPDNNNYGKHIITFSIPVFDNDSNVIGITGLDIDLNNIISMLDKSKMTIAKEFVILTSDGIYLSHFNNELIGKSIKSNELFSNYNTDSVLNEISQNNNVLIENILGADNSALTVLYHHINIRNIDDTRLYAGIVLKNETIEINTSTFLENSLQYCVIFLILISVSSIFLAIIVENIFSNKITIEIDKKVLKK